MNNRDDHDFFTAGYLMVVNVIQATTFAVLVLVIDKLSGSDIRRFSPYILCSFIMLINLLYGYLIGSRDLRWPLDGFDVLIPVLLGLFQCTALLSLASKQPQPEVLWFRWTAFLMFTLVLTVINAWIKSSIYDKKNYHVLPIGKPRDMIYLIVGLILTIIPVVVYHIGWWNPWFILAIIWILVGVRCIVFYDFCQREWKKHREKSGTSAKPIMPSPTEVAQQGDKPDC